ncbi:MAG: arginase family protein [Woeseiaceae bacterium]|nr:arginase family protein [Woeseiaceae bacterium]
MGAGQRHRCCHRCHRSIIDNRPVYLTFDIDCLDPAFAPGTGTPVCGGLTTYQAMSILRGMHGIELVGMDVVEVAPAMPMRARCAGGGGAQYCDGTDRDLCGGAMTGRHRRCEPQRPRRRAEQPRHREPAATPSSPARSNPVIASPQQPRHREPAGRGDLVNLAESVSVRDRHVAALLAMTGLLRASL